MEFEDFVLDSPSSPAVGGGNVEGNPQSIIKPDVISVLKRASPNGCRRFSRASIRLDGRDTNAAIPF